jgi:hypothetical protein
MACPGRLAVFVSTEETDVEVEPWIFEIIRVAAIKGDLLFGGENQAHVGVFPVAVKVGREVDTGVFGLVVFQAR